MRTSIVILVGVATAVNVGLWFWSRPTYSPACAPENTRIQQCKSDAGTIEKSLTPRTEKVESRKLESIAPASTSQDQPWVNTIRDSVLQLSLIPKFSDKVLISGLECKGSACEITGSTVPAEMGSTLP